jgi:hypothetical protein
MRIIIKSIILLLWICTVSKVSAGESYLYRTDCYVGEDSVMQVGEELTYNVSFLGIDLGQVKVKNIETTTNNNRTTFKAVAYIDSYKGVPLVDLHAVYESMIDPSIYTHWFQARDKRDTQWVSYIYNFDYPRHSVYVEEGKWKSGKIDRRDTLRIDTLTQDGLSLFFYARKHVADKQGINVPVIVNEKKGNAYINFTGERTKEKIDAVDYPIDLIYFDGQANFIGVFGLTGGFEGWFSNDNAHVPILAKMKVLIGSIHIELVSWKRNGWSPPRYAGRK